MTLNIIFCSHKYEVKHAMLKLTFLVNKFLTSTRNYKSRQ
ncbi:hypothetical protein [Citrobacter freundii]|uniref:Uncharacterized protein n=1 Tax=Citrobacter freundii TaxID=546 RepID=A0A7G2IYT3_CITFR|nr:hypothetical protein [Citrobacter freundii]